MYCYSYVCSTLCILFHSVVLCIVCVYLCTVLLPPGVNPIAVNKIYHSYHIDYATPAATSIKALAKYCAGTPQLMTTAFCPQVFKTKWPL